MESNKQACVATEGKTSQGTSRHSQPSFKPGCYFSAWGLLKHQPDSCTQGLEAPARFQCHLKKKKNVVQGFVEEGRRDDCRLAISFE